MKHRAEIKNSMASNSTKEMLEFYGLDAKKLSEITGHTEGSIKSMLAPGKEPPRWFKLALYMWEHNKLCGYVE